MNTKDGRLITFNEDDTSKDGSIWCQYTIQAFVDNTLAGYLRTGWIKKETAKKAIPTIWHFGRIQGWTIRKELENISPNMKDWTPEQKSALVNAVDGYFNFYYTHGESNVITPDNVDNVWKKVNDTVKNKIGNRYKKFIKFNVDRPIVDYIEALIKNQNVGVALYIHSAKWVHDEFGLFLYASDLQSDSAKHLWYKMEELGWVINSDKGKYLRPDIDI